MSGNHAIFAATKAVLWLAAALVPLQSLSATACGCSSPDLPRHDRAGETRRGAEHSGSSSSCCSEKAYVQQDRSRCGSAKRCGGPRDQAPGSCGSSCACDHSSPSSPPALPTSTSSRNGEPVSTLALGTCHTASLFGQTSSLASAFDHALVGITSLDRCVALSRLIL